MGCKDMSQNNIVQGRWELEVASEPIRKESTGVQPRLQPCKCTFAGTRQSFRQGGSCRGNWVRAGRKPRGGGRRFLSQGISDGLSCEEERGPLPCGRGDQTRHVEGSCREQMQMQKEEKLSESPNRGRGRI